MANPDNLITQSDVSRWGIVAMFAGGIAVVSGVLALAMPAGVTAFLHAGSNENVSSSQLLARIDQLNLDQERLIKQNTEMRGIVRRLELERSIVSERVGALETAIPMLLEVVPADADIDRSIITASIDSPADADASLVEGGSIIVTSRPLFPDAAAPTQQIPDQPMANLEMTSPMMPAEVQNSEPGTDMSMGMDQNMNLDNLQQIVPDESTSVFATDFGIAVGKTLGDISLVDEEMARNAWQEILNEAGSLLIGISPALSQPSNTDETRLVAGPIADYAGAELLCARIVLIGINCVPVQYDFRPDEVIATR